MILDILERLIGFETTNDRSNLPLISYVEDFLTRRGFRVTRVTDPGGDKAGLFAQIGPDGDGVLLSAHTDVVPVAGQVWTRDPFRLTREGDRLYGRGTTDMKGFLAAMLVVADHAAQCRLTEPLKLAISYDEEIGCVGMARMIDALVPALGRPRACIVGEPTDMQVAIGHKGKRAFRAVFHGQSGHSALAPQFVNALHLAGDFMAALRDIQADLATQGARGFGYDVPYSTVHVGMMSGGTALNIVPDRAELAFEFRHLAADAPDDLQDWIGTAAEQVAARYRDRFAQARIEIMAGSAYPGLDTAPDAEVTKLAQGWAQSNSVTKVAFGTEAGFFDALGIPSVVCGPGSMEGQGHKPDEYLTLSQLTACQAMLARVLKTISA